MGLKYEIQFRGYQPQHLMVPIQNEDSSPFENVNYFDANEILATALNSNDVDDDGWISGDAGGEDFQIRDLS